MPAAGSRALSPTDPPAQAPPPLRALSCATPLHRLGARGRAGSSGVGDAGLAAIAASLRTNATLTSLDLRSSPVSAAGVERLCDVLAHAEVWQPPGAL